ncbi:MAG: hypothetical protein KatS3mg010_1267 [Acidimicrobiia bacterium]|nr:MAG: hypothetical protein KatS3mg010_1267 [Acidimicrobiia bacterium]
MPSQAGRGGPGPLRPVRAWARVVAPGAAAAAALVPVVAALRSLGFVADVPLAVLLGWLALGTVTTTLVRLVVVPGGPAPAMWAFVGSTVAVATVFMYLLGWGAALAVGYVFLAADALRVEGRRAIGPAVVATIVSAAAGEVAVATGVVESLLPRPAGYGIAVLSTIGAVLIIVTLGLHHDRMARAESLLARSEARFRALVQHSSDAIVVLGADGSLEYASPTTARLFGWDEHELTDGVLLDALHPDHAAEAIAFFEGLVARPGAVAWTEVPMRHADGTYRWFEIGVSNRLADPAVGGMVCNMRDVTDRRSAQDELRFQAHHDALTKLPNRWLFLERLEQSLEAAATRGRAVGVLFLDVDRFKLVNDSLGHEVGDRLLATVAERLTTCVRPQDVVARFGGDEFTILLGDLDGAAGAISVAERVRDRLALPVVIEDRELFASVSIGIALSSGGDERASDLLRQADVAMYLAKERGRSRWELFDPQSAPEVVARLELEGDLWRALEQGELRVLFQPEIELATGRVVAAEALVRWEHPRRGLLDPDRFVPLAEESSLIVAIDRYVLNEACRWARRWSAARPNGQPLVVSVNLSPRFIHQADVVATVMDVLRETGVDPRCIQIEITERTAVTDLDETCARLHRLRALGVRVAVDDFGTGYSSLSYLKRLPIDVLKLDRSFVAGIESHQADVAIVQAVVTMGHALGMKVTAEGVEVAAQAAHLRWLGCDRAMGWYWSRAVPGEDLAARAAVGYEPIEIARPSRGVVVPMARA